MRVNQSDGINVLVLVTDYPGENRTEAHRFVHVRNLFYKSQGINVTVLNFAAAENYSYEGIQVISPASYRKQHKSYDLLISHQANIRQHYRFMKRFGKRFPHFILFFHGHEVLRLSRTYPQPYAYVAGSGWRTLLRDVYDSFKLWVWHRYIPQIVDKSTFIFVSQWMLDEFLKSTGLDLPVLKNNYDITYNCVGKLFEENSFDGRRDKKYDFVTIRSNLDGSKYCLDVVNELARNNPGATFLVVGKGDFFRHYTKPDNLTWVNMTLNHQEIIQILQTARCALMPTRTDAQGLMMCEMATFGMPLITSDISVCHEALDSFENVKMIPNEAVFTQLLPLCKELEGHLSYRKNNRYFNEKTSAHEVEIIKAAVKK